jgi:hypothetical protein
MEAGNGQWQRAAINHWDSPATSERGTALLGPAAAGDLAVEVLNGTAYSSTVVLEGATV